ncbi:MAG: ATP phosphoribosyltransferase [Candidatus Diapherotrites archaeon]|uniref:ATP phosphoribosyltransferase n=1 Tax=Candidatus Iainarchaeum sp. TaxID=3101447 RepID=A0A938YN07_9ARCH|nr:ATP phosphoribosyltransferase [Candidatus Diapherotrites archaeon]
MKLAFGTPKGSLEEKTMDLFKKAGFEIAINGRSYFPSIDDPGIELMMARAQEMPRFIEDGVIDAGITGRDWCIETKAEVKEVAELQYSKRTNRKVRWVLAVNRDSKINSVKDLEGKRIATELVGVTERYLKKNRVNAEVEFSWGATETKCPKLVDAIVELTETGSSLRANNLKIIDELLESVTVLIANKEAWKNKWKREKISRINDLLQGVLLAEQKVLLEINVPKENFEALVKVLPCMKSPTISELYKGGGYAIKVAVDKKEVREIIGRLKKAGAESILEYSLQKAIV